MELNERTLASERIFDGRLLKVYRDQVELSGGCTEGAVWLPVFLRA